MVNLSVLHRKLLRDLFERKGVLISTTAILAVGVAGLLGMVGAYRDLSGARDRYYHAYHLADFTIRLKRAPDRVIRLVREDPNVRWAEGRVAAEVRLDPPDVPDLLAGTLLSLPERRRPVLNDVMLLSGRWFSADSDDEVLLNHDFARANGIRPGRRLGVQLLDKRHDLLVIGTVRSPEYVTLIPPGGLAPDPARFAVLYAKREFVQRGADLPGAWNQITGSVHDRSEPAMEAMLDRLERALDPWGVTFANSVEDEASYTYLKYELQGLRVSATVMPAIFLGVAMLILHVMLRRVVAGQRTEIGTLKALGWGASRLFRHYLGYGVVVGLSGAVLGWGLGHAMQGWMLGFYRPIFSLPGIVQHVYLDQVLLGFVLSVGAGVAGCWQGARLVMALEPAAAMHPPPPERGSHVFLEEWGVLWRRLSFRWRMVVRSLVRNPFRSSVTVVATSFATALILTSFSNLGALDYLMNFQFERLSHEDARVSLREPVDVHAAAELARLAAARYVEPQLNVVADLSYGPHEKRLAVQGLPPGSRLATPIDAAGGVLQPPRAGLLLSRKLAEILHVGPGDVVDLRPLVGRRRKTSAPVVGTVETYMGLSAYADLDYLSRLLGERRVASALLALESGNRNAPPLDSALLRYPTVLDVSRRERALRQVEREFGEVMGQMLGVMVALAGLIAFGSILNASMVSLSERRRDVATLRVLGYDPAETASLFWREQLLLSLLGVAAGVAMGHALSIVVARAYDTELYRFPVMLRGWDVARTVGFMLVFLAAAQVFVVRMVRRLNFVDIVKVKE